MAFSLLAYPMQQTSFCMHVADGNTRVTVCVACDVVPAGGLSLPEVQLAGPLAFDGTDPGINIGQATPGHHPTQPRANNVFRSCMHVADDNTLVSVCVTCVAVPAGGLSLPKV
jgi:hypothetical protein